MKLELKAKHFKGTLYCPFDGKCAIEKAYIELTGNDCCEGVVDLSDCDSGKKFNHEEYDSILFNSDKQKSESHNFDETVIRTIELIEQ